MIKRIVAAAAAVLALGLSAAPASAAVDPAPAPAGKWQVTRVNYNAKGADVLGNRWQEAAYFKNRSTTDVDISGWTVHDTYKNPSGEHTNAYTFPAGTTVKGGATVVVSSSSGVNKTDPNATQVFYMDFNRGYNGHWLNNGGDTVFLEDASGKVRAKLSYAFDNGYYVR
ncbi:lamin tail domain-containing protein [Nonomuraea mesophila]|nr:lamin tail domain-containing protein [Nonomuraea mesophila]